MRAGRVGLTVLVVLAQFLAFSVFGAPAMASNALVSITIEQVTPAVPTPTETVRISGQVTNTSEAELLNPEAVLRISNDPLRGLNELRDVADGREIRTGQAVQTVALNSIPAKESTSFAIEIPFERLLLPRNGVYYAAIEITSSRGDRLGIVPTSFPWIPTPEQVVPVNIAWVWPLLATPGWDANKAIVSVPSADQFADNGRLTTLLNAGAPLNDRLTWVSEPQTRQLATLLAGDHQQVLTEGDTAAGQAMPSAASWLARQQELLSGASVELQAVGYATPDTNLESTDEFTSLLVEATIASSEVLAQQLQRPVSSGFAWPQVPPSQSALNELRRAGVRTIVVPSDHLQQSGSAQVQLSTESGDMLAYVGDELLGRALAMSTNAGLAQQLFVSTTAMTALTSGGSNLIALPDPFWNPQPGFLAGTLAATAASPWTKLMPMSMLPNPSAIEAARLKDPMTFVPQTVQAREAVIGASLAELGEINDILLSPDSRVRELRESLMRSASGAWVTDPDTGMRLASRTLEEITTYQQQVRVTTSGLITFPNDNGRIPLTIANDFNVAVNVGVRLAANPEFRVEAQPIEPITVPPGQKISLEVPVKVVGSGRVLVSAQLVTPSGDTYGQPAEFEVRTTAYTRVAGWVTAVALALLSVIVIVGVIRSVRRGRPTVQLQDDEQKEQSSRE